MPPRPTSPSPAAAQTERRPRGRRRPSTAAREQWVAAFAPRPGRPRTGPRRPPGRDRSGGELRPHPGPVEEVLAELRSRVDPGTAGMLEQLVQGRAVGPTQLRAGSSSCGTKPRRRARGTPRGTRSKQSAAAPLEHATARAQHRYNSAGTPTPVGPPDARCWHGLGHGSGPPQHRGCGQTVDGRTGSLPVNTAPSGRPRRGSNVLSQLGCDRWQPLQLPDPAHRP